MSSEGLSYHRFFPSPEDCGMCPSFLFTDMNLCTHGCFSQSYSWPTYMAQSSSISFYCYICAYTQFGSVFYVRRLALVLRALGLDCWVNADKNNNALRMHMEVHWDRSYDGLFTICIAKRPSALPCNHRITSAKCHSVLTSWLSNSCANSAFQCSAHAIFRCSTVSTPLHFT